MAADVDIINGGLSKLGEQTILAVSDPGPAANLANRTYEDIRDALLREFPWNFAIKRTSLAAEVTAPAWGYARSFVLPPDCLRLLEVNNPSDEDYRNEGNRIVTDMTAPLQIKYVARVASDTMDFTFREALSARLAMEWAEPLAQTTRVVESMIALYRNKLQVARAADSQTDRLKVIDASDFLLARF